MAILLTSFLHVDSPTEDERLAVLANETDCLKIWALGWNSGSIFEFLRLKLLLNQLKIAFSIRVYFKAKNVEGASF